MSVNDAYMFVVVTGQFVFIAFHNTSVDNKHLEANGIKPRNFEMNPEGYKVHPGQILGRTKHPSLGRCDWVHQQTPGMFFRFYYDVDGKPKSGIHSPVESCFFNTMDLQRCFRHGIGGWEWDGIPLKSHGSIRKRHTVLVQNIFT